MPSSEGSLALFPLASGSGPTAQAPETCNPRARRRGSQLAAAPGAPRPRPFACRPDHGPCPEVSASGLSSVPPGPACRPAVSMSVTAWYPPPLSLSLSLSNTEGTESKSCHQHRVPSSWNE